MPVQSFEGGLALETLCRGRGTHTDPTELGLQNSSTRVKVCGRLPDACAFSDATRRSF